MKISLTSHKTKKGLIKRNPGKFSAEFLHKCWSSGQTVEFKQKKYTVNKMSYGAYFLQPAEWQGGEREGFAPGTIWLHKINQNTYEV